MSNCDITVTTRRYLLKTFTIGFTTVYIEGININLLVHCFCIITFLWQIQDAFLNELSYLISCSRSCLYSHNKIKIKPISKKFPSKRLNQQVNFFFKVDFKVKLIEKIIDKMSICYPQ